MKSNNYPSGEGKTPKDRVMTMELRRYEKLLLAELEYMKQFRGKMASDKVYTYDQKLPKRRDTTPTGVTR